MGETLCLNGLWEYGPGRKYAGMRTVPGLHSDPDLSASEPIWYKRRVALPHADFHRATLLLKGARFCPRVYINGELAAKGEGGMAPIELELRHKELIPGGNVTLEIELMPLDAVPATDASCLPEADRWRTNLASCLWNDVELRLEGRVKLGPVIPFTDFERQTLTVRASLDGPDGCPVFVRLKEENGRQVAGWSGLTHGPCLEAALSLAGTGVRPWSPDSPALYRLTVSADGSERSISYGFKDVRADGKRLRLNGDPLTLRGMSVVWHRWLRDPEARELAFNPDWFDEQIVQRLKKLGANYLRFHLGLPPENLLDLCDRAGLLVQLEWCAFHGLNGTVDSLCEQWSAFLSLACRHPSFCIFQPWNEAEGADVSGGWTAFQRIEGRFPPMLTADRDTLHAHRYWWSLFENVGLYYDSPDDFPLPVIADEFGGNYLDGLLRPCTYPSVLPAFRRFLGDRQSDEARLELQTESCARMAEYWRRLGAAGFAPFCALSSPQDGCHYFLGPLVFGVGKPVWEACRAAFSPVTVSLDLWDRNFVVSGQTQVRVVLINDSPAAASIRCRVLLSGEYTARPLLPAHEFQKTLPPFSRESVEVTVQMPHEEGRYRLRAVMPSQTGEICSSWRIRVIRRETPELLKDKRFFVLDGDPEWTTFLLENGIAAVQNEKEADALICGGGVLPALQNQPAKKPLLLANLGPCYCGQDYPDSPDSLAAVNESPAEEVLPVGAKLSFTALQEPESCVHPTVQGRGLWAGLEKDALCLSNGLRGGVNVPAVEMALHGQDKASFTALWRLRGADISQLVAGRCVAYELHGHYAFAPQDDTKTEQALIEQVAFLQKDAPSLRLSDAEHPVKIDLGKAFAQLCSGETARMTPLARCGEDLRRAPVLEWQEGHAPEKGGEECGSPVIIFSQLIMRHRLHPDFSQRTPHGARYDPAMERFALNLLCRLFKTKKGEDYEKNL